ncbi:hypothetical protein B0H63DRAFT_531545 [Podospora didyma]|uniref:Tat pathway signal sequence n=1 Tax=Podospora didyma TaxID=330526 RepID=A0AAE0P5K7_9PEZI|nr:hypothetical protein B0H63DRAFT_531545 [Podospora didyma]
MRLFFQSKSQGNGPPPTSKADSDMMPEKFVGDLGRNVNGRGREPRTTMATSCLVLLIVVSGTASFIVGLLLGSHETAVVPEIRTPIIHDIGMKYTTKWFNGSFLFDNEFRQPAADDVDAAWESLGTEYRPVVVPENLAKGAGLSETHVRVSDKYGGGYVANVEGLHHLHCLNLLRQSLHFNYLFYNTNARNAFVDEDWVLRSHIGHCLDTLRQQLMCVVDVGMLGQIWYDQRDPKVFPDFNTKHQCRDFEAVRRWAEEHQMPEHLPEDYLLMPRKEDVLERLP